LRAQRKRTTLAITFTLTVAIGCRRKEELVGGNRTKHDKRDAHQKNQDSLPANFIIHVFSGVKFAYFCSLRCRTELNACISARVDTAARPPSPVRQL
jgi:hypothetical protein